MMGMVADVIALGCVALPFVAMPLMWRRMKRVQAQTYGSGEDKLQPQPAWEEALEGDGSVTLARVHHPNDDLIALGEKGRHARWPLNNE
jgi:hypothetical protein